MFYSLVPNYIGVVIDSIKVVLLLRGGMAFGTKIYFLNFIVLEAIYYTQIVTFPPFPHNKTVLKSYPQYDLFNVIMHHC